MQDIRVRFIEKLERTSDISSFRFQALSDFFFCAGQFVRVVFDEQEHANKQLNKYLSLSCAPGKAYLEFTKKASESEFCQRLLALNKDDELLLQGPLGKCVFAPERPRIGFLVGGIGITPVISMLEYIVENDLSADISLLYSNWTKKDIAFKQELDNWSEARAEIKVTHILAESAEQDSGFLKGRIDKNVIEQCMPDYGEREIFIFGPPVMVSAMQTLCRELDIAEQKTHIERFVGY